MLYSRPTPSEPTWSAPPPLDRTASSLQGSDDEDDEDPLTGTVIGPWDNMFSLAEAARLTQDGHVTRDESFASGSRAVDGDQPRRKRRKTKDGMSGDELLEMKRALPLQRGSHVHAFQDPVELGMCSLEKAKELYDQ